MKPTISDIKQEYQQTWLQKPEVVSVGLGLTKEGDPAIIVGVTQLTPELAKQFPITLKGYPVLLETLGSIHAQ